MIFAINTLMMVFVWVVSIVFLFIKKLEIKDGLQYTNKNLSLPVD